MGKKGLPSKQLVLCQNDQQDDMIESFEKTLNTKDFLIEGKAPHIVRGSMGWFLEILHPEVNKGGGLKAMCDHLGIPLSNVVAFGDGDNDLEFIEMAGCGVAMKNARDVLRTVADEIIEFTNDEEGVVKTLQRLEKDGNLMFAA